ncbi:WYL domain-containing transcriptional regulator [Pontibacter sp. G13]|uniref:helix-turn-helix transcriptional regulator n=1 Tax=Pontibacter sp. G13 TaxID=3074898 RepID=UPI00288BADC8|nr:WYL domain-containing transcriptional regulator [Pontibacter sp. G13]WNJ20030.1 WYL domain-containing transcriptional regulator [Pontibacter sp. G13]
MKQEKEHGTRLRLLLVMRALIEQPGRYTKTELAKKFNIHKDTVTNYFNDFRNAGFELASDSKHRYHFVADTTYKALQDLLHFSEDDQDFLIDLLQKQEPHSQRSERIQRKIAATYDFTQLGYENLRNPHLSKLNLLRQAEADHCRVWLKGYRSSNSSEIRDRLVEPFHVSPEEDILHAFDVERGAIRHYLVARISHILPTDEPWQHAGKHNIMPTDPFRIVHPNPVQVHLRLSVGAYNELLVRFPLTRQYIRPAAEPNMFDFECKVNPKFFGLTNFILGNYHLNVEVVSPESLKDHLREKISTMNF